MLEDVIQIKNVVTTNTDVSADITENIMFVEKIIWSPSTCTCENGKYSRSINGDSAITRLETIEVIETIPTKTIVIKVCIFQLHFY